MINHYNSNDTSGPTPASSTGTGVSASTHMMILRGMFYKHPREIQESISTVFRR